jgi:hypothetical protein
MLVDTSLTSRSISIESALITLSINTAPTLLASPAAAGYSILVDHLVTLHFLDPTKFDSVKASIDAGTAYNIVRNPDNGKLQIELQQSVVDTCAGAFLDCAIRNDIVGGDVANSYSVYPMATGFGTSNTSNAVDWLTHNLLGVSEHTTSLALNMTNIVQQTYNINHKGNRAWYINPGYKWTGDKSDISDKVITLFPTLNPKQ